MKTFHPSEREIGGCAKSPSLRPCQSAGIEASTRCHLFGIGESSSTSASTTNTGATDEASVTAISGVSRSNVAGETLVQSSNLLQDASLIQGSNVSTTNKNALLTDNAKAGDISVSNIQNDPDLIRDLIGTFAATSAAQTEALTALVKPPATETPQKPTKEEAEKAEETKTPSKWLVAAAIAVALWIIAKLIR
mgnify:CR=1 FL=1